MEKEKDEIDKKVNEINEKIYIANMNQR